MNSQQPDLLADAFDDDASIDPEIMLEQILADPGLVQHIVRTRKDRLETIVGYFRCKFSVDQQRYVLHVPFTPPLASIPTIDALVNEQSEVRTRVTDRQKFGARIEIILSSPSSTDQNLLVEVVATSESET